MTTTFHFPPPLAEALIFLNGERTAISDSALCHWRRYRRIIVADGAWNDLAHPLGAVVSEKASATPPRLTVMGDGDSIADNDKPTSFQLVPDQDATDFDKVLQHLIAEGYHSADVFWGSGKAMDHYLGNLSVAAKYANAIRLCFFDTHQWYFFLREGDYQLCGIKDYKLTLYPFPEATKVSTRGLRYPLNQHHLTLIEQQSLRNEAVDDTVLLKFSGQLWVFIEHLQS